MGTFGRAVSGEFCSSVGSVIGSGGGGDWLTGGAGAAQAVRNRKKAASRAQAVCFMAVVSLLVGCCPGPRFVGARQGGCVFVSRLLANLTKYVLILKIP